MSNADLSSSHMPRYSWYSTVLLQFNPCLATQLAAQNIQKALRIHPLLRSIIFARCHAATHLAQARLRLYAFRSLPRKLVTNTAPHSRMAPTNSRTCSTKKKRQWFEPKQLPSLSNMSMLVSCSFPLCGRVWPSQLLFLWSKTRANQFSNY